ncbi:MAG: DUF1295 domain-containing protein [Nanoarchaeota archaeon]|nr:DUF1295 domain-containing protein [Nanoarchaeota archaeon]
MDYLFFSFLVTILIQMLGFIIAFMKKTDKLTDMFYGLGFIVLAGYWFFQGQHDLFRTLLFFMIILWAIRLSVFLFIRISKIKKDDRFDAMRQSFFRFGGFWLLQAVAIFVISLSFVIALQKKDMQVAALSAFGLCVWVSGFIIEGISDYQKFKFKQANSGFIKTGLWKYSRHPNYFGEILCWVGVYIYCVPLFFGLEHLAIVSPVFIASLLIFVSGIPILEKNADIRYGKDKQYLEYKKKTSVLILLPPKSD